MLIAIIVIVSLTIGVPAMYCLVVFIEELIDWFSTGHEEFEDKLIDAFDTANDFLSNHFGKFLSHFERKL